jgi:hypothetical protein
MRSLEGQDVLADWHLLVACLPDSRDVDANIQDVAANCSGGQRYASIYFSPLPALAVVTVVAARGPCISNSFLALRRWRAGKEFALKALLAPACWSPV